MKILLYNNSHLPSIGGKEIVVHHLARAYQKAGHDVVLAGPSGLLRYRKFEFGYPVHRWARLKPFPASWSWAANFAIECARFDFDIIHAHTTYPSAWVAARLKRLHGRPIAVTPHGADIHKVPEIDFGMRLDPQKEAYIRWALEQSQAATAISQAVEHSLIDAGMPADRIEPIPNGVDVERFAQPVDFDVHARFDLPRDQPYFVSVGNYHPRKGHEVLVDAVEQLHARGQAINVVIVGANPHVITELVADKGLSHCIKHAGPLYFPVPGVDTGPDVLAALLAGAAGYVSSSMAEGTEGLSLALLEAMAAGACPVATRVSGNQDIIDSGRNGLLVEPGSSAALADGMQEVAVNAALRCRFAHAARETIAPYSWAAIADRYLALFERLLAEEAA